MFGEGMFRGLFTLLALAPTQAMDSCGDRMKGDPLVESLLTLAAAYRSDAARSRMSGKLYVTTDVLKQHAALFSAMAAQVRELQTEARSIEPDASAALIAKQAIELDTLKGKVASYDSRMRRIVDHLTCIGGPLNDNAAGYTHEQRRPLHNIKHIAEGEQE